MNQGVSTVPGKISGRGYIRDADGNIKGEIAFEMEGTPEMYEMMKKSFNLKENDDGSDPHGNGA